MKCKNENKTKKDKKKCDVCGEYFEYKSIKAKYCSSKCKSQGYRNSHIKKRKKCLVCSNDALLRGKYCSKECRNLYILMNDIVKSKKYKDDNDYVECKICGFYAKDLSKHISYQHCSVKEYHEIFPNSNIRGNTYRSKQSDRLKGDKNPAYQHGGILSPFSDKFVGKSTKEETIKKANKTRSENPHKQRTKIEYYLHNESNANWGLASYLLKEKQANGRKENFIIRYGEELGLPKWKERQEKWLKNMPRTNFSMASQELFWSVVSEVGIEDIYFAELSNGVADFTGKNNELTIRHEEGCCKPDFIQGNKIIEFDGDYWHAPNTNQIRDNKRQKLLEQSGYEVLRIKEKDYYKNKQNIIKECINFLNK